MNQKENPIGRGRATTATTTMDRHRRHPLLINEVLHNVFGRMNLVGLLTCRKVCRLWKDISTYYVSNCLDEVQIKFTPEDTEPGMGITEHLEMLEDEEAFQFKTFYFVETDLKHPLATKLLKMTGENIRTLKLFYGDRSSHSSDSENEWETEDSLSSSDSETYETPNRATETVSVPLMDSKLLYSLLFEKCPNLKKLTLGNLPSAVKNVGLYEGKEKELGITHINIRQDYQTPKYSMPFLLDLFKACPQLEEVRLEANYDSYSQDRILLEALVASGRIKTLQKLHLNAGNEFLNSSLQYSQLKKLTIQITDLSSLSGADFTNLISMLSNTLNTLNLRALQSFGGFRSTFPPMKKLKKLRIGILISPSSFGEINYSVQFPKLKKLILTDDANNYNLYEWFSPNQNSHNVLEELELLSGINDPVAMKRIAKLFPNVTKLNMAVQTDTTLREIWSGWPKLEELLLCVNPNLFKNNKEQFLGLDSLLTGIPTELCREILARQSFNEVELEEIRKAPSISDLKFLRKLFIHSGPNINTFAGERPPGDYVTDVSGYLALSKMSSLTKICIGPDKLKCAKDICSQLGMTSNKMCGTTFTKIGMAKERKPIKWYSTTGRQFSFFDIFNY